MRGIDDIKLALEGVGLQNVRVGGKWALASCPSAATRHNGGVDRHPSFGVQIDLPHRCRCFACGVGSWSFAAFSRDYLGREVVLPTTTAGAGAVKPVWTSAARQEPLSLDAAKWLRSRGIDVHVALSFGVKSAGRDQVEFPLTIPGFDQPTGAQLRRTDVKRFVTEGFGLFGASRILSGAMRLVVVEGPLDALAVAARLQFPVVALCGSVGGDKIEILLSVDAEEFIVLGDGDPGGVHFIQAILDMTAGRARVVRRFCPSGTDPADLSRIALIEAMTRPAFGSRPTRAHSAVAKGGA